MRGATAQHGQYQQKSPGADHGTAADAEQTQRPSRRHGTCHRQDLPINVLHSTIRSLEDFGDAPGSAFRPNIVRIVQTEAGCLVARQPTDVDARINVIGRRLQERRDFQSFGWWTTEYPYRLENRILFQSYNRALELVWRQIPCILTLMSFRGFSSRSIPPSTMNPTRSIRIPSRAVHVMSARNASRPLPMRLTHSPSLVRFTNDHAIGRRRRVSRSLRTDPRSVVGYQLQIQRCLLMTPLMDQYRRLRQRHATAAILDPQRLAGFRLPNNDTVRLLVHREARSLTSIHVPLTWTTRGTKVLRRYFDDFFAVCLYRVDPRSTTGYWRWLLVS